MKLCIVAGAKGGSARTTTAVRVAEHMCATGVSAGIVELSPFPTAHLLASRSDLALVQGAGASTTIAADSILRPHRDKVRFAFVDTGRLDAERLAPWLPLCHSVLIASPADPFSFSALPALWSAVERIRRANASIRFMGILPVLVAAENRALLEKLRTRFPGQFIDDFIPFDEAEIARAARAGAGIAAAPESADAGPAAAAWRALAARMTREFDLAPEPVAPPEPAASDRLGLLGRLWRVASGKLGRVSVVGKEVAT